MKGVVREPVYGVECGVDVAVEVGGGEEKVAVDGGEVGAVWIVVFVVEMGSLREVF